MMVVEEMTGSCDNGGVIINVVKYFGIMMVVEEMAGGSDNSFVIRNVLLSTYKLHTMKYT